jgi:hypothetical protein
MACTEPVSNHPKFSATFQTPTITSISSLFPPHDDFDIPIIWQNMHADSDFLAFRKESQGPIERILIDFARVLESGVLEQVISLNASKHLFCVTFATTKGREEVMREITKVM